jgi:transcriptional regulator with XRE-family HTH domain
MSRYALIKRSGLAPMAVMNLERGTDPHLATLKKLARGLGVSVVELLPPDCHERPPGDNTKDATISKKGE